ncbi:TetR/AcrR family transcriptional regulator [Pseudovibrio sp. JE062]|uniref:TetR/AcrR family transcriptional regulator n=1 Tax=Pseudovibrio sp. JE062 TaxID=439495 RepID=UPI000186BB0A|nr:TetR/AcrR family transcriptional regulator [Pseudovibrio sp. JE062]EEA91965.1 transcriptional regulator, TetR family [Pseudovibrio sp. JE062]
MTDLEHTICTKLEGVFAARGFTAPGVAELRKGADVSLRTLYKYFPSKEDMIIGALEVRHRRYLSLLKEAAEAEPQDRLTAILDTIEHWMQTNAPHGCMDRAALSAYPESEQVSQCVTRHKQETQDQLATLLGLQNKAGELFLIHEGAISIYPLNGSEAFNWAKSAILSLTQETAS